MSNRRKLRPSNPASEFIRSKDGTVIPGGCNYCAAYEEIQADHYGPDMHRLVVVHDDWCPFLAQVQS